MIPEVAINYKVVQGIRGGNAGTAFPTFLYENECVINVPCMCLLMCVCRILIKITYLLTYLLIVLGFIIGTKLFPLLLTAPNF